MSERKIVITADGSPTIFDPVTGDHYHSLHGALNESRHVFIKMGLDYCINELKKNDIAVLEVGFGTGLNAALTIDFLKQNDVQLTYHTLEPIPIIKEEIALLQFDISSLNELKTLHECPWETEIEVAGMHFTKFQSSLQHYQSKRKYDLIYYDAFAPSHQSEMWEQDIFTQLEKLCTDSAMLVSYCAQGQFRRNLESAGFSVERLPGPPGKREMIRASLNR